MMYLLFIFCYLWFGVFVTAIQKHWNNDFWDYDPLESGLLVTIWPIALLFDLLNFMVNWLSRKLDD